MLVQVHIAADSDDCLRRSRFAQEVPIELASIPKLRNRGFNKAEDVYGWFQINCRVACL